MKVNGITGLKIAGWAYGGTPAAPSATAVFGTITYTYAPAGSTDFTAAAPTLPGSYVLKAAVAAGTDTDGHAYAGAEATVNFTVSKAVGPAAPKLRYMDSVIGYNTGMIFDLDTTMEYQRAGETVWHDCTEPTLRDLAAGTYYVRVKETATTAIVDGHLKFGQMVGYRMADIVMEKAKKYGVGVAVSLNAAHAGRVGSYVEYIAKNGFIGFCTASLNNFHK